MKYVIRRYISTKRITQRAVFLPVLLLCPAFLPVWGQVTGQVTSRVPSQVSSQESGNLTGDYSAKQDAAAFRAAKMHNTAAAYRSYLLHCQRCAFRQKAAVNHHRLISPQRTSATDTLVAMTDSGANLAILRIATPAEQRRVLGIMVASDSSNIEAQAKSQAIDAAVAISPGLTPASRVTSTSTAYFSDSDILVAEPIPLGLSVATRTPAAGRGIAAVKQLPILSAVSIDEQEADELTSFAPRQLRGHKRTVWSIDYHPTGKVLASGGADKQVRVWDMLADKNGSNSSVHSSLNGHQGYIAAVDFSNDGRLLASVGGDRSVRLWQWPVGKPLHVLRDALGDVSAVRFSMDGKRLISGADDADLRVWDVASGKLQQRLKGHDAGVTSIAVANNGVDFASGGADGRIITWRFSGNKNTNPARRQLDIEAHSGLTFDVEFNANASQLYSSGGDGLVRLWNAQDGSALGVLSGHRGDVTSLAATQDGRFLISGGEDRSVRIWDIEQRQQVQFIATNVGNITTLALSPSGKRLAVSGSGETVQILRLDLPAG